MDEELKSAHDSINLEIFVDRLVEEKNLPKDLEKEVIDQIKSDLLERAEDRVNAVIINNLPSDKLEEFNKILDENKPDEEVRKFCADNIPNLPELIATELISFKQTYLS